MDPEEDKELLYIAEEGIKTGIPEPWKPCRDQTGRFLYFNTETNEVSLDHPLDEYYQNKYLEEKKNRKRKNKRNLSVKTESLVDKNQKFFGKKGKSIDENIGKYTFDLLSHQCSLLNC